MPEERIPIGDPRHEAAVKLIAAAEEFRAADPSSGAVKWLEDTLGRVVIFTRGEYRDVLMRNITDFVEPTLGFEQREVISEAEDDAAGVSAR